MMVVQWRDPEVQSKKRREAEALERQQGLDGDDDKDNDKVCAWVTWEGCWVCIRTTHIVQHTWALYESCSWCCTFHCHMAAT